MENINSHTLKEAYKPYDLVYHKETNSIGLIILSNLHDNQTEIKHQREYSIRWLDDKSKDFLKNAWFCHDELERICNIFEEIANNNRYSNVKLIFDEKGCNEGEPTERSLLSNLIDEYSDLLIKYNIKPYDDMLTNEKSDNKKINDVKNKLNKYDLKNDVVIQSTVFAITQFKKEGDMKEVKNILKYFDRNSTEKENNKKDK